MARRNFGLPHPEVEDRNVCVDAKRQWRHAGNVWQNSMIRSMLQTMAAPVTGLAHLLHHDSRGHGSPAA